MKTYRIKPLEWLADEDWHYSRNGWVISPSWHAGNYITYTLSVDDGCFYSNIESVEKAKELAEELNAADLAVKLEEYKPE